MLRRLSLGQLTVSFKLLVSILALGMVAFGATTGKVEGVIKGRSGPTMIVQTADNPRLVVMLQDQTKVSQVQGVLKARRKGMSMAALIPGLLVQVEGTYNADNQLVASSIKFKGDDLQQAQAIQAGLFETKQQTQQQKQELEKQAAELQAQQDELAAQQKKVAANKAAIDAAVARFGQLDEYYILDEVTVYFPNGKTNLDAKYRPELMRLAEKAKTIQAYMVQVIGYASSSGSDAVNQKLSEDRAHNVTIFLSQQADIPLMNMLAPGAMGESRQVGNAGSTEGDAANRRVVVRILQNKGIAEPSGSTQ